MAAGLNPTRNTLMAASCGGGRSRALAGMVLGHGSFGSFAVGSMTEREELGLHSDCITWESRGGGCRICVHMGPSEAFP
jgi:hypothetical protein